MPHGGEQWYKPERCGDLRKSEFPTGHEAGLTAFCYSSASMFLYMEKKGQMIKIKF